MNTSTRTALRLLAAAAVLLTVATGLGPSTATAGPAAWVAFHPSRPAEVRPFVQSFARKPQARPQRALPKPKRPPEVPVGIDGCDHGYHMPQRPGLCVPWRFPPGVRALRLAARARLLRPGLGRHGPAPARTRHGPAPPGHRPRRRGLREASDPPAEQRTGREVMRSPGWSRRRDRRVHQPRSARRCGCGISSTLMPTMASPRPRETFAITSGSS
ncbi:hypothetical protein ACFQZ4_40485 [Catellatospora coxensis]